MWYRGAGADREPLICWHLTENLVKSRPQLRWLRLSDREGRVPSGAELTDGRGGMAAIHGECGQVHLRFLPGDSDGSNPDVEWAGIGPILARGQGVLAVPPEKSPCFFVQVHFPKYILYCARLQAL